MFLKIPSVDEIAKKAKETLQRFPLSVASAFIVALVAIYLIEMHPPKGESLYQMLFKVSFVASLTVLVFAVVRLLAEGHARSKYGFLLILSVLGALFYYYILPDDYRDFSAFILNFRHLFLMILFGMAILWSPFLSKHTENSDYWEYAKGVFFSVFMTFVFTVILIVGIDGAIFAIEKLFDIEIPGKRYAEANILITALFSVGYFLSQIPKHPLATRFLPPPPKVEMFFTKWILTPLSLTYFVILYAYSAKLLMTQEWPKGILAWLIVIFSVVAVLTYLFWTHFAKQGQGGWRRWIWLAVLLQTVMLFIAIGMRISQYSWTESRYMVFVLGLWLFGISLYFLFLKRAKIKWIFISLSLLIAVTQFGPFGAYNISRNAQQTRLEHMLTELKNYAPASKAPVKLRYEISDTIAYLNNRHGQSSLKLLFPKIIAKYEKNQETKSANAGVREKHISYWKLPSFVTKELGFIYINRWEYQREKKNPKSYAEFSAERNNKKRLLDVKGYDYVTDVNFYGYETIDKKGAAGLKKWEFPDQQITLGYTKDFQLIVDANNMHVSLDLGSHLRKLTEKYGNRAKQIESKELTLQKNSDQARVKLELDNLGKKARSQKAIVEFGGKLYIGGVK